MSMLATSSLSRRTIETAWGDVAYLEAGDGPTALFIHGVFLSADLWRAQLAALSDIRRCVAVDLLAHGASPLPRGADLTIGEQADMVLAFIEALGEEQVDLVANDSGGAIAQIVAAQAPHRIRTLTLTNCDAHDNWPPADFQPIQDMARAGLLADGLMAAAVDPSIARAALTDALESPDAVPESFLSAVFAPFADSARARAVESWVAGMESSPTVAIHDDLARLRTPTLIAWGTADVFFDRSWAQWLSDAIPGTVDVVEVPGGKLLWPLEHPEILVAHLRDLWTNTANYALLARYLDAWNRHDLDTVTDLHSEDTVFTLHVGGLPSHTGRDAVRRAFENDLTNWPDAHWEPRRRSVTSDRCILEAKFTATAAAMLDANGAIVPAGSSLESACVDILEIRNGRISRKDTYLDALGLLSHAEAST